LLFYDEARLIRSVRQSVSKVVLFSLVTALVLLRIDYGNATLVGLPTRPLCPPRRCSDYFQCPEVWSRDATTPRTTGCSI